jgi:hypothetical protein
MSNNKKKTLTMSERLEYSSFVFRV